MQKFNLKRFLLLGIIILILDEVILFKAMFGQYLTLETFAPQLTDISSLISVKKKKRSFK